MNGISAREIRARIHRELDIHFVESRFVQAYMAGLEFLLNDIRWLWKSEPGPALDVLHEFIREIPRIFDSIHDEYELADFCAELCATAIDLSSRLEGRFPGTVAFLLDVFEADDYGRFADIPDAFLSVALQKAHREWLASEVRRRLPSGQAGLDGRLRNLLGDLEGKRRRRSNSRRR